MNLLFERDFRYDVYQYLIHIPNKLSLHDIFMFLTVKAVRTVLKSVSLSVHIADKISTGEEEI